MGWVAGPTKAPGSARTGWVSSTCLKLRKPANLTTLRPVQNKFGLPPGRRRRAQASCPGDVASNNGGRLGRNPEPRSFQLPPRSSSLRLPGDIITHETNQFPFTVSMRYRSCPKLCRASDRPDSHMRCVRATGAIAWHLPSCSAHGRPLSKPRPVTLALFASVLVEGEDPHGGPVHDLGAPILERGMVRQARHRGRRLRNYIGHARLLVVDNHVQDGRKFRLPISPPAATQSAGRLGERFGTNLYGTTCLRAITAG